MSSRRLMPEVSVHPHSMLQKPGADAHTTAAVACSRAPERMRATGKTLRQARKAFE